MNNKRLFAIVGSVLFAGLSVYYATPVFAPQIEEPARTPFWEVTVEPNLNSPTVFNTTLNKSTIKDAIRTFGNRLSLSIFEEKGKLTLEGYFRETLAGGLSGRVAFTPEKDEALFRELISYLEPHKRSTSERTIYDLPKEMQERVEHLKVTSLAFIPLAVQVKEEDILRNFGPTDYIFDDKRNSITHYLYPAIGVDATLDRSGSKASYIQYSPLESYHERIIEPLLQNKSIIKREVKSDKTDSAESFESAQ